MEFLDKLILPHSTEHLRLLIYILALALIILLAYTGALIGTSVYSVLLNVWGRKKNDSNTLRFSRELIGLVTAKKNFALIFGILPLFTVIITYSQLMHETDLKIAGILFISMFIYAAALISIYFYKYTFYVDDMFKFREGNLNSDDSIVKSEKAEQMNMFIKGNLKGHKISAASGIILLIVSAFIITTCIQVSFDRTYWREGTSFFKLILTYSSVIKFFYFLLASFAITSIGILFYYFSLEKDHTIENKLYAEFISKFSLYSGMILTVILPLIVIINLLAIPNNALSNTVFGINLIILVLLFLLAHYLYSMIKQSHTRYTAASFTIFTLVFVLFVVNDQVAFDTSSQRHRVVLASEYNEMAARLAEATQTADANGEEIYQRLCASCHRFDQQIVGPAYNAVLGKYEGKMDQLTKFIQDPVKVNPDFPPMPDLGLKPAEAKATAEYLIKTYKQ